MVLGLNPSDSDVSYAPFLAPVDTALICSRVKKVLEGHGLESHNVHSINYLNSITERNFF